MKYSHGQQYNIHKKEQWPLNCKYSSLVCATFLLPNGSKQLDEPMLTYHPISEEVLMNLIRNMCS